MKTLEIAGQGMSVTRLDSHFGTAAKPGQRITRDGPIRSTPIPFRLVAGQPFNVSAANDDRIGLILQNRDAAATLYYSFGGQADLTTGALSVGQTLLLDFITPTDALWVYAAADCSGYFCEFARVARFGAQGE